LRKAAAGVERLADKTPNHWDDRLATALSVVAGALEGVNRLIRPLSLRGRGKP